MSPRFWMITNRRRDGEHLNSKRGPVTYCLLPVLCLTLSPRALSQEAARPASLIVDPTAIGENPKALAEFQALVAKSIPQSMWRPVRIEHGDSPLRLSQRLYNYPDGTHPEVAKSLAATILEANGLASDAPLRTGQILKVPPLPQRPIGRGANVESVQIVDLPTGALALSPSRSQRNAAVQFPPKTAGAAPQLKPPVPPPPAPGPVSAPVRKITQEQDAAAWRLVGSTEQITALAAFLAKHQTGGAPQPYFLDPGVETVQMKRAESKPVGNDAGALPMSWRSLPSLAGVNPRGSGHLVLVDYFDKTFDDESCPHGKRVQEAALHALSVLGAEHLAQQITPQEVDFYGHRNALRSIVEEFIGGLTPAAAVGPRALLQAALDRSNPDPDEVPVIFLIALYSKLINDPSVSVVSASIYSATQWFPVLPSRVPDNQPILFAALVVTPLTVEKALAEPIRDFFNRRHDVATVLVGGWLPASGSELGQLSDGGDDAACLGFGVGWGGLPGMCLKSSEPGTSFATPTVAALTFAYSEYLTTRGISVSPSELRMRLFVSVDLQRTLFGRRAAPGVPRPETLFRESNSIILTAQGGIEDLDSASGVLTVILPADGTAPISLGVQSFEARALEVYADDTCAVFRPESGRWEAYRLNTLALTISRNGHQESLDLQTFRARQYQRIIVMTKEGM